MEHHLVIILRGRQTAVVKGPSSYSNVQVRCDCPFSMPRPLTCLARRAFSLSVCVSLSSALQLPPSSFNLCTRIPSPVFTQLAETRSSQHRFDCFRAASSLHHLRHKQTPSVRPYRQRQSPGLVSLESQQSPAVPSINHAHACLQHKTSLGFVHLYARLWGHRSTDCITRVTRVRTSHNRRVCTLTEF